MGITDHTREPGRRTRAMQRGAVAKLACPMDPLAHTLFGAALAATGLRRTTRYATVTLLVGSNLPDLDVLSYVHGPDFALGFRRGWTHGIPALVVLPLLWTALVLGWARWRRAREGLVPARVLGLATFAVVMHPTLDWLNDYGVRWLMPLDPTWFYGAAVFIVDPWIWWALGTPVFLAHSTSRRALAGWLVLAGLTTAAVVVAAPVGPSWGVPVWAGLLAVTIGLRVLPAGDRGLARRSARLAVVAVAAVLVYAGAATGLSAHARADVESRLPDLVPGVAPEASVTVGPVPWNPLARNVVVADERGYRFGSWSPGEVALDEGIEAFGSDHPAVPLAREAPCLQGFLTWSRLPYWQVDPIPGGGWEVSVFDARYTARHHGEDGFGTARVRLAADGTSRCR